MRAAFFALALGIAAIAAAADATAQCASNASSCVACHEAQRARPVLDDGLKWHKDHAFGDLCAACHGGDPAAATKEEAHAALWPALADPQRSCGGCHADAEARAGDYRANLATGPSSTNTPPAPPTPPSAPLATGGAAVAKTSRVANRVLAVIAAALGLLLAGLHARHRKSARRPFLAWLRAPSWPSYAAGAGLGLTVTVSEAALGRPIAASGAFDRLAAYLGRALFASSPYYAYIMHPAVTWQVWLLIGAALGAFASARCSGVARWRWLPDTEWVERFGPSRGVRLAIGFFGAVLVQVGAGIAGGCTSGLAISGGAVLAPAAFVFMAGMFAGGIPTARAWGRVRRPQPTKEAAP